MILILNLLGVEKSSNWTLVKNLRTSLVNNKEITLPADVVKKHNLPSDKVKLSHLQAWFIFSHFQM